MIKIFFFLIFCFYSGFAVSSAAYTIDKLYSDIRKNPNTRNTVAGKFKPTFGANDPVFGIAKLKTPSQMGKNVFKMVMARNPYWMAAATLAGFYLSESGSWQKTEVSSEIKIKLEFASRMFWVSNRDDLLNTVESYMKSKATNFTGINDYGSYAPPTVVDDKTLLTNGYSSYGQTSASLELKGINPWTWTTPINFQCCQNHQTTEDKPLTEADGQLFASDAFRSGADSPPLNAYTYPDGTPNPDMFSEIIPAPNLDPRTIKSFEALSSGHFQTTDPAAENYIDPNLHQSLDGALASFHAGDPFFDPYANKVFDPIPQAAPASPNDVDPNVDAANNINVNVEIPPIEIDALTQKQYEESNQKYIDAANDAAAAQEPVLTDLLAEEKATFDAMVADMSTGISDDSLLPDFFDMKSIWTPVASGSCIPFTVDASVARQSHQLTVNQHCPTYDSAVKPLLAFVLYIMTALYIIRLFGSTLQATSYA